MLRRCDIADLQHEVCMLRLGISGVQNLRKERRAHSVPVHFSVMVITTRSPGLGGAMVVLGRQARRCWG